MADDGNVKVFCRVRPPNEREGGAAAFTKKCVTVPSADPLQQTVLLQLKGAQAPPKTFTFDRVFHERASQNEVFELVGVPITRACLEGYNGTIFAYGQTGSGKTFTMQGPDDVIDADARVLSDSERALRGVVPRVFDYLFQDAHTAGPLRVANDVTRVEHTFACSFMEIYNERVYDLLDLGSTRDAAGLILRENGRKGVSVEGLIESVVSNARQAAELMAIGARNRRVGQTAMNRESSRSHSVFVLQIQSTETTAEGITRTRLSRFNLVDLAGSERQKNTEAAGERLKEAGSINKSLSALGNVIMGLVEQSAGKNRHVHYRDSKLTFLLKDSLGGNSKTFMIATVSPAEDSSHETLSTLKFAQRAKLIRNNAVINEDTTGSVLVLQEEIVRLRRQLQEAQSGLVSGSDFLAEARLSNTNRQQTQSSNGLEPANLANFDDRLSELEVSLAYSLEKNEALMRTNGQLSLQSGHLQSLCSELKKNIAHLKLHLRLRRYASNEDTEMEEYESSADAIEWRMKYEELEEAFVDLQERIGNAQASEFEERTGEVDKLNVMYLTLTKQLAQVIRDKHDISSRLGADSMVDTQAVNGVADFEAELISRSAEFESQLNALSTINAIADEKAQAASLDLLHSKQKEAAWKIDQQRSEAIIAQLHDRVSRLEAGSRQAQETILEEKRKQVDMEIALRQVYLAEKELLEATLAEKMTESYDLRCAHEQVNDHLNAVAADRDQLSIKLTEAHNHHDVTRIELKAAMADVSTRVEEIRFLSAEFSEYQRDREQREEDLTQRLSEATSSIAMLESTKNALNSSLANISAERSELQVSLANMETQLNSRLRQIEELRTADEKSAKTIHFLDETCAELKSELANSNKVASEKSMKIDELLAEVAVAAATNEELVAALDLTKTHLSGSIEQIRAHETAQVGLREELSAWKTIATESKERCDELTRQVHSKNQDLSQMTESNSALEVKLEEMSGFLEKDRQSLHETQQELESTSSKLHEALGEIERQDVLLNQSKESKAQLSDKIKLLDEELSKTSELLQITEAAIRECKAELAERTEEYKSALQMNKDEYAASKSQLEATIAEHEQHISRLKTQHLDELHAWDEKRSRLVEVHRVQTAELGRSIEEAETRLAKAIDDHKESLEKLQLDMRALQENLSSEKQSREDENERARKKIDVLLQEHKHTVATLNDATEKLKGDHKSEIASLNLSIIDVNHTIGQRDATIEELQAKNSSLAGEKQEAKIANGKLQAAVEQAQREHNTMLERCQGLENDLGAVRSAKAAAEDQVQSLIADLDAQVNIVRERDATICDNEAHVLKLKGQLERISDDHAVAVRALDQSRRQLDEMIVAHNINMTNLLDGHASQVEQLTKDAEAAVQKVEGVVSSLQSDVAERTLEIDSLQQVVQNDLIKIPQLEEAVAAEIKEKKATLAELADTKAALGEREQAICEKNDTIERVSEEFDALQEESREVKVRLSGRIQLLEADLSDLNRAHELLTSSHDSLTKEHSETVTKLQLALTTNARNSRLNEDLTSRVQAADTTIANLSVTLSELETNLSAAIDESNNLKSKKQDLEDDVSMLKQVVAKREDEIDEKDSVISGMEETVENLEADKMVTAKELQRIAMAEENLRAELLEAKESIEAISNEMTLASRKLNSSETRYAEAVAEHESKQADLRSQLQVAISELEQSKQLVLYKEEKAQQRAEEIICLSHKIDGLSSTCESLEEKIRIREVLKAKMEGEFAAKEESWKISTSELSASLKEAVDGRREAEQLVISKSTELGDCIKALESVQSELTVALAKLSAVEEKSAAQLAASLETEKSLCSNVLELKQFIKEQCVTAESKRKAAEENERALEKALQEVRQELNHSAEKVARQRKRNDLLQEANAQLAREIEAKSGIIKTNDEGLSKIQDELRFAQERNAAMDEELLVTHKQLSSKTSELEETTKAREQLLKDIAAKSELLKAKQAEWEAKDKELRGRMSVVGEMEEQIADESKKLTEEKVQAARRKKDAEKIKREYDRLKVRVGELETLKIQYTKERDKYRREVNTLTQKLDEISKANDKLVGHDNKRQKIQHHIKVKEENNRLQEDVRLLTEEKFKLEVRIGKLELTLKEKENLVADAQVDISRSPSSVKSSSSLRNVQPASSSNASLPTTKPTESMSVEPSVRKRLRSRNE